MKEKEKKKKRKHLSFETFSSRLSCESKYSKGGLMEWDAAVDERFLIKNLLIHSHST